MAKRRSDSSANDMSSASTGRAKAPRTRRSLATVPAEPASAAATAAAAALPVDFGAQPTEDEIRFRAYFRYLERGGSDGGDLDDWVSAEQELKKN
jgi:hypothetical protein